MMIPAGIREKAPALHTTAKINCNDFTCGGMDETENLCIFIEKAGHTCRQKEQEVADAILKLVLNCRK